MCPPTDIWLELEGNTSGGGGSGVTSLNGETGAINIVAGSGIIVTPSGQDITITATGASPVGSPNTFAGFDNAGDLESIPGFNIDTTSGGMNESLLEHPNNIIGGFNANTLNVAFQPLQDSPDDDWNIQLIGVNFDDANSGFSQGTSGEAATLLNLDVNHGGTGPIGSVSQLKMYYGMGNGTDPLTIKGLAYAFGFADINDNVTIDGQFQGFDFQPHIHSGAIGTSNFNMYGFNDGAQVEIPVNSYNSVSLGPHILSINNNNSYNGVVVNPVIPTLTGNANLFGFGFYPAVTSVGSTGGITGMNMNPTITTLGTSASYQGITIGGQVTTMGTSSNINGYSWFPNITTNHGNIEGLQFTPQLGTGDANFTGINIGPNGTVGNAQGISINLNNVTDSNPQGVVGINSDSRVQINATTTLQPSQGFQIGNRVEVLFHVPPGSPVTGTDSLGNDFAGDLSAEDDIALGPIGLGWASVGFIADMSVAVTKTVAAVDVFVPAVALPDPGYTTGGNVTDMTMIRTFAPLSQGGTLNITNLYGLKLDSSFGSFSGAAINAWGLYIQDANLNNFIEGKLGIGVNVPSSSLHLKGSTIAAGSSPLKINSGALMTAPENGAIESDGTNIWWTDDTNVRQQLNNTFLVPGLDKPITSTQTTAPTSAPQTGAGTGATSSVSNATDVAGQLELVTGTLTLAVGPQVTVTFDNAYATAPIVVITPQNATAAQAAVAAYVTSSTTGFTVNFAVASTGTQTFDWFYHVIETQ